MQALERKYDNFLAPSVEIRLGGQVVNTQSIPIQSVEVELSAEGAAGGCTLVVDSLFDYENSRWSNEVSRLVKAGAKLEVSGGYMKERKPLFSGYVDEYTMEHSGAGAPRIILSALDGLGYLRHCRQPYYGGKKQGKAVVQELLKKSVSAGFASGISVDAGMRTFGSPDFTAPLVKEQMDDFKFLRLLAQRYGAVLMCLNGELIFDALWGSTSPILSLTVGQGLLSFQKRVSLKGQVGQVEVWGRDENHQFVQGSAASVSVGGTGSTAAQLVPALKDCVLREFSEYARTQAECKRLAQARLDGIAMGLVSGEGTCVGIPELIPGRYLSIRGMEEQAEGAYFLSKVVHSFTLEGYQTRFEVKGARTT